MRRAAGLAYRRGRRDCDGAAVRHLAADVAGDQIRVNAIAPARGVGGVPAGVVADAVVELDESDHTGRVLAIGDAGDGLGTATATPY